MSAQSWDPDRITATYLPPQQPLNVESFAAHIAPHFDVIMEDLPRLSGLPSPEQVRHLGDVAGVPHLLDQAPDVRLIAEYAQAATPTTPEVRLDAFGNGATMLVIGEARNRITVSPLLSYFLDHTHEALHTHPEPAPDNPEDPVMSLLPSPEDLDISNRALYRQGDFIAHPSEGLLFYTTARQGDTHEQDFTDFVWRRYPSPGAVDALSATDFALAYLDFLGTTTDIILNPWSGVPQDAKMGELALSLSLLV